jgi:C_GCAxxG_C_C family probable redox protein
MTKSDEALQYFNSGFNCAQSVLTPFGSSYNISEEHCLKIACAFGAGIGRQQHTCGAVTGAAMVLGLHFGKGKHDDNARKLLSYDKTRALFKEFSEKHGSVSCLELLDGLRMNDVADLKKIEELGLFHTRCVQYVRDAADMVERMTSDTII